MKWSNFSTKVKYIMAAFAIIIVGIGGYLIWQYFHPPQAITAESQQQAETPAGIDLAAKNAHIEMLQSQLEEAAAQIAALKNQKPDTIIKTVPVEVTKVVEKEVEKRGADFAIVTDPAQPDKQVDLKQVEKLPADTMVTLNQYNVFAYKKVVRGINIYPDWSGLVQQKPKLDEVTVDVSRRITKDGKYLGAVAGYDFKNKESKLGLRYSF